jgi:hypothetical protein
MRATRGQAMEKWMCYFALGVSGLMLLLFLLDLFLGIPFGGGKFVFVDIVGILAAGVVLYLGWNAYLDVR